MYAPRTLIQSRSSALLLAALLSGQAAAQQQAAPAWEMNSEFELGAVYTSGNTDDENLRIGAEYEALRGDWEYTATFEGFRSSKDDELAAQRAYLVGASQYNYGEDHFAQLRASHEQDKFSGFEQQSDVVVSYGQLLMRDSENMTLDYTVGAGVRNSDTGVETTNEAVLRLSTHYTWDISDNARFIQELSTDAGDSATVTRSLSAIESDIMESMSLRFSVRLRHQTQVPVEREKLDTETSMTLVLRF